MNETYLDIHIAVPPDEQIRDILSTALSEYGFAGFLEDDRGLHCYIEKEKWNYSIEAIIKDCSENLHLPFVEHLTTSEFTNKNWNAEWESDIKPIQVTERITITPSWHPVASELNKIVLIIDPKMTFGTGYHETTRLMLRLMEEFIKPESSVLDIGTGTGILAIAAIKLGAKHAIGIDVDEWSLQNGIENTERNGVAENVEIRIGSMESVDETGFEIILANIIRNTILELLDNVSEKLVSGGFALFSGLLKIDRPVIEQALLLHGFKIISTIQENEWIAIAAHKE